MEPHYQQSICLHWLGLFHHTFIGTSCPLESHRIQLESLIYLLFGPPAPLTPVALHYCSNSEVWAATWECDARLHDTPRDKCVSFISESVESLSAARWPSGDPPSPQDWVTVSTTGRTNRKEHIDREATTTHSWDKNLSLNLSYLISHFFELLNLVLVNSWKKPKHFYFDFGESLWPLQWRCWSQD